MSKEQIIEQIIELATKLDGKVSNLTCYNAKEQWKKITIDYNFEERN
tara:strand:+ start:999 stop:1139 length:141 start_codon:yes stop_codon:yes gene_type:complete